jgi:hypothetical protein
MTGLRNVEPQGHRDLDDAHGRPDLDPHSDRNLDPQGFSTP